MPEAYEKELSALRREIATGGARPSVIDNVLAVLVTKGDERAARELLLLLSDQAEYDEGMFSLIHAAESLNDQSYVHALLSIFPDLSASSPRWASIVLMRVLNSTDARVEIVRQLRSASEPIKKSVRELCAHINEVSPQFLSKTIVVSLAAR